jgi:hypothetical protein
VEVNARVGVDSTQVNVQMSSSDSVVSVPATARVPGGERSQTTEVRTQYVRARERSRSPHAVDERRARRH